MDRNRALMIGLLIGGVLAVSAWGITHLVRSGTLPFLRARVEVSPTTPTPFAPPGATPGTEVPEKETPPTPAEPVDPFTGAAQTLIDIIPSP